MVTYHYVKFYFSIIIHLEVININVHNFWCTELIPDIEKFLPVAIFKMAVTMLQKFNIVRYHQNLICG
jgi:hypothetical protein